MRIQLQNTDVIIGNSSNPAFIIDLAKVFFNEFSRDTTLGNIVSQTIKFKGYYSITDAQAIKTILTNTVSSY